MDANYSSGACCDGTRKVAQSEPHQPPGKPNGANGCGCGAPKGAAEVYVPKPVAAEKADGGCCGGK